MPRLKPSIGRPRILVVATGARGGIGRYEKMLREALGVVEHDGGPEFVYATRRVYPAYLGDGSAHDLGEQTETSVLRFALEVAREVRSFRPHLVVFLHYRVARLAPFLRSLGMRRYAVVAYGDEIWPELDRYTRRILRGASRVLAISQHTADSLARVQRVPPSQISVTPLSLDPEWTGRIAMPTKRSATAGPFRILSVSRLERDCRDKGIDDVLRALPDVIRTHPQTEYHVIGDGDDRAYLEDLAQVLDVSAHVFFHGFVNDEALADAYQSADVFALTSRQEGFGLVFLEAMTYGLPVVAARAAAAPEVVTDGVTGLLVDAPSEIADRLLRVQRDSEFGTKLGVAGRHRALNVFTFEEFRDTTNNALFAALGTHPPDPPSSAR